MTQSQAISPVTSIRCDRRVINCDSIIWLEGDYNYTRIYQQGQPMQLSARTLKWYEQLLHGFVRVRRDALVNPSHVRSIRHIPGHVPRLRLTLHNGVQIEVARRRQMQVRKQLQLHA